MPRRKRLHPEKVILGLGGTMVALTWAFGLIGFITESERFITWAGSTFAIALAIISTPLIVFVVGLVREKLRSDRHD